MTSRFALPILLASLAIACCHPSLGADPSPREAFFESKVRPLLIEHCYECHSREADEQGGGLRVDTASSLLRGGSRGAAIKPGDVKGSLLVTAIRYQQEDMQMPPDAKLSDAQIEILEQWISMGAYDPRTEDPAATSPELDWRMHWAFQTPGRAVLSGPIDARSQDLIDAIAISRMREDQVEPAEPADAASWLRRVHFDLLGMPPTSDEISAFVRSDRPDARVRVVDALLARPEFGERWGRYWMDVARYADTVGYTLAGKEPRLHGSERYRDWVIRSYNDDMPYDRQILLQLAADTVDPDNAAGDLDAMGFLTVGRRFLSGDDTMDDRIDVITRGLLGMTVQCARCHDHKFDPIPTMDYYSLVGVMNSSQLRDESPSPLALFDVDKPRDHPVWIRGQRGNRGPIAPRRFLTALRGDQSPPFTQGSGRAELARAISDPSNPLTSRVMVNRVWMHLMGRPFVLTPSDFGVRSDRPTQAAVLDDLSAEFTSDYSVKRLIRRVTGSNLYGQSSRVSAEAHERDPDNAYFARGTRRRRDFESMRDSVLLLADHLDHRLGGEPLPIHAVPSPPRRTVYAFVDRQKLPAVFRVFDVAIPDAHSPQRYYTTVPQQSLYMLNDPFILDASTKVAAQAVGDAASDRLEDRVTALFQRVLSRKPSAREHALAIDFCRSESNPATVAIPTSAAWSYGYGTTNAELSATTAFTEFPSFSKGRWMGGNELPDKQLGWTSLSSTGGHPGQQFAAIRRWTAPLDGRVEIDGTMNHPSKQGDGVRLAVVSGDKRLQLREVKGRGFPFGGIGLPVEAGQAIDFIADRGSDTSHDSFEWIIKVHFYPDGGETIDFDSEADFSGKRDRSGPPLLTRFQQLAQTLLLSNEFAFID